MTAKESIRNILALVNKTLDVVRDKEDNDTTIQSISESIVFKGSHLWILILAVLVACLGLNMNSIHVIIGAMLISPIMGPIMGVGLGIGIHDLSMVKRGVKNLTLAAVFAVISSAIYFLISPHIESRNELIERSTPTIYDVLIAVFGGLAGIVAKGSRDKGNVLPGVAISTALIPPLCTSGYGLVTLQWHYFFGGIYLYLINCVYIAFSTWIGTIILKIPKIPKRPDALDDERKKVMKWTVILVCFTGIPSIYITVNMIDKSIRSSRISNFINTEFNFEGTQVLSDQLLISKDGSKTLEITLIGEEISEDTINKIRSSMPDFGLKDIELDVTQEYSDMYHKKSDFSENIVKDILYEGKRRMRSQSDTIQRMENELNAYRRIDSMSLRIAPEIKILFPEVAEIAIANTLVNNIDSSKSQQITIAMIKTNSYLADPQKEKLKEWLEARIETKNIELIEK